MKRTLVILGVAVVIIALLFSAFGCQGAVGPPGESIKGERGARGAKGAIGEAGISVTGASVNSEGHLVLTLSDGKTIDAGYVKGDKGDKGATGSGGGGGGSYGYPVQGMPGISGAYVILTEKDSDTWKPIDGGAVGLLLYKPIGAKFTYDLTAYRLEPGINYSLIYYADFDDRFNQWGGNNPGALITTGISSSTGTLTLSGSAELGISLPCPPDANIDINNYSGAPDYYSHAFGAKIWLVPSDCYDATATQVISWTPDRFLFETDLITYIDTD